MGADLLEGIVAMPPQLFYTTGIPVSLYFLNKNKKQKRKTLLIDARSLGTMVSRKLREMTDEDIAKIGDTFTAFENGSCEDVTGFCAVVDTAGITKHDYILTRANTIVAGINFIIVDQDKKELFIRKASLLRQAASLCRSLLDKNQRLEAAFFEAVRTALTC